MAGRYMPKNVGVYWRGTYERVPLLEGPYYDEAYDPTPWYIVVDKPRPGTTVYSAQRRGPWILPDERTP